MKLFSRNWWVLGIALGLSFFIVSEALAQPVGQVAIKEIIIKGNKKIEEAVIRNRLKTRVGDVFDPDKTKEEVKSLYRTGFFRDITVDAEGFEGGIRLTFTVVEKPIIREIKIEGNKEIKIDKIREKMDVALDSFVNRSVIAENARKIKQFYEEEGYYMAVVNYDIKETPDAKAATVTFKIIENGEFKLKEIKIEGNKGIYSIVIKLYLQNKEQWFYFLWGTLNKAELEKDAERIKLLYLNKGYLDIKVDEPVIEVNEKERALYVIFKVTEGARYEMGKVSVRGNAVFTQEELLKEIKSKDEKFYNRETLSDDITRITDKYSEKGYIYADVVPLINPQKDKAIVDVGFDIQEGKKAYLEKIEIVGNIKTHDKVIRRQFRVNEHEVYNAREVKDARQRLLNLGFFEEINLNQLRGSAEDQVVLKMDVKERPTGSFGVGGGYGSEGLFGQAEIIQANLFGRGQRLSVKGILGQKVFLGEVAFFEPFLFDSKISFNAEGYSTQKIYPDYTQRNTGGAVTFGFPIIEELRGSVGYRYDYIRIFDETFLTSESDRNTYRRYWNNGAEGITTTNPFTGATLNPGDPYYGTPVGPREWAQHYSVRGNIDDIRQVHRIVDSIRKEEKRGATSTSSVTVGLLRDTVNNRLDPSEGQFFSAYATFAGPALGGSNAFASFNLDYGIYIPLFWKLVYGFHTHYTYILPFDRKVIPVSERVYLGGATTIRGFQPRAVGPYFNDEPIGGNQAWFLNNEITFPIYWTFRGAVFFDAGNVWMENQSILNRSELRIGVGAGLRFLSPIGPIRLDYGFNPFPKRISNTRREPVTQFHFLVGTFF